MGGVLWRYIKNLTLADGKNCRKTQNRALIKWGYDLKTCNDYNLLQFGI
jgi:hypothetical protein